MKATMVDLKRKLKHRTRKDKTGLALSTVNPFWANKQQLDYMRDEVKVMYEEGKQNPTKKFEVSETQLKKLMNEVDRLADKFLTKL